MNNIEIENQLVYWRKKKKQAQKEIDNLTAIQSSEQCAGYSG